MDTRPKSHVFSGTISKNFMFYLKIGLSKFRFPFLHNILHKNILSSTSEFRIKIRVENFPISYSVGPCPVFLKELFLITGGVE